MLLIFAISIASVCAFIGDMRLSTVPGKVTLSANSTLGAEFLTEENPNGASDYAMTCAIDSGKNNIEGNVLGGTILATFNLASLGFSSNPGDFVLNMPVNTATVGTLFSKDGPGTYTLSCCTLSAFGASHAAQVDCFHGNFTLAT